MKKRMIAVFAIALTLCLVFLGCSGAGGSGNQGSGASSSEPEAGSLVDVHQKMGKRITSIQEVSAEACSKCHSWEKTVKHTEGYWKTDALGKAENANPHDAHVSETLACEDCHKMTETQVNACNTCHLFENPKGWE